jgi:hypothetical protein
MQLQKQLLPAIVLTPISAISAAENPFSIERQAHGHDIDQNVDLKDALIRFGITILLPILALLINWRLVIFTAPIMTYLFATAITHFCVIKYLWRRYISHMSTRRLTAYGLDPSYPEELV